MRLYFSLPAVGIILLAIIFSLVPAEEAKASQEIRTIRAGQGRAPQAADAPVIQTVRAGERRIRTIDASSSAPTAQVTARAGQPLVIARSTIESPRPVPIVSSPVAGMQPWPFGGQLPAQIDVLANFRLNATIFSAEINAAAQRWGVDPALIRAIAHAESSFNPRAQSPKGAQGLMQIIPATARRFDVDDPFDPAQSLDGGARYLRFLLDRFSGDFDLAAAAYNAGEGAVDRHRGIPPYSETQTYVSRVRALHRAYQALSLE